MFLKGTDSFCMVSLKSQVYVSLLIFPLFGQNPSNLIQRERFQSYQVVRSLIETRICDMSSSSLRHMEPTQEREVIKLPKASEVLTSC